MEFYETKKAQINSVGWQHTRVDNNNKTNKAQSVASAASHHPACLLEGVKGAAFGFIGLEGDWKVI